MNSLRQVAWMMLVVAVWTACARPGGRSPADSTTPNADSITAATVGKPRPEQTRKRPHLTRMSPSSGSLATGEIIQVELAVEKLTATGNTVFFGSITLGDVPSRDGRTVHFAVPQTVPSKGEVPPMALQPGRYGVYIVNSAGTSDTLIFTIKGQLP